MFRETDTHLLLGNGYLFMATFNEVIFIGFSFQTRVMHYNINTYYDTSLSWEKYIPNNRIKHYIIYYTMRWS